MPIDSTMDFGGYDENKYGTVVGYKFTLPASTCIKTMVIGFEEADFCMAEDQCPDCAGQPDDDPCAAGGSFDPEDEGAPAGCVDGAANCCDSCHLHCHDGLDNDCDGLLDCEDPDCADSPPCACSTVSKEVYLTDIRIFDEEATSTYKPEENVLNMENVALGKSVYLKSQSGDCVAAKCTIDSGEGGDADTCTAYTTAKNSPGCQPVSPGVPLSIARRRLARRRNAAPTGSWGLTPECAAARRGFPPT